MNDITVLKSPGDIDLSRHGVIEAHAGTGKTYTIVAMALRILELKDPAAHDRERYIHIREILLVTYTEKAAGELKRRIREGIEKRLGELGKTAPPQPELVRHLEDCRSNLHEALIGTIHGVCLRLLQTWPFETGVHFSTEMADDGEGLEHALRESMRTDWQNEAACIPWALSLLAQQGEALEEKHFGLIRDTAEKLLDDDHAVLDRSIIAGESLGDLRRRYERDVEGTLESFVDALRELEKAIDTFKPSAGFHENAVQSLESTRRRARQVANGGGIIDPVWVAAISKFKKPDKNGTLRSTNICDAALKKTPSGKRLGEAFDVVQNHGCVISLQEILGKIILALVCDAAEILAKRWNRVKRGQGLLSFGDMLRLMRRAVARSPEFVRSLRDRLRYGIIDEFQDTSILQWEIFRSIFLDDCAKDGPRIFIVGDPKQSIYSFQGADVQSYLQAKKVIVEHRGIAYSLETNYRSLPEMIDGYNSILGRRDSGGALGEDWFGFDCGADTISYPSTGKGGGLATAAGREKPAHPLTRPPVQVMALEGNASQRIWQMAENTAAVIRALKGSAVSVPNGETWTEVKLDYKDFAVIVEAHHLAEPFLERFQDEGIPAVKYKMEGVFQSAMARDLHALLRAIAHPSGDAAPRLAALLTHFFNKRPQDIDPDKDLEPCARGDGCANENLCIAHALQEWSHLAASLRWSRLFRSIFERTGVRERLIRLSGGQRHLADLTQVADYCCERLYRGNLSLVQLVEHLGRLLDGKESAGQDANLHVLATEKSSVKVLTMHAAKGLEFPVVFAVTGGSRGAPGAGAISWTAADGTRHVMPVLNNNSAARAASPELSAASAEVERQARQERRRLLYVALTRAQAMLFLPMHFGSITRDDKGDISFTDCPLPSKAADNDLTERLRGPLDRKEEQMQIFLENQWKPAKAVAAAKASAAPPAPLLEAPDMASLGLPQRVCIQTSYTQLSSRATRGRDIDRSEEEEQEPPAAQALPGGRETGDALHLAIEELLRLDDPGSLVGNNDALSDLARKYLERNGILENIADNANAEGSSDADLQSRQGEAIASAVRYIRGASTSSLPLPGGGEATVAGLAKGDRSPEMEFMLGVAPHWVHGYMDLVFRIANKDAKHPWRYFVLDWKSDTLDAYNNETIGNRIVEMHYDLQARVYCHALDRYLAGLLRSAYDPARNLGGAVYVFLRSFGGPVSADLRHTWTHDPAPHIDAEFTRQKVHGLIGKGLEHGTA